MAEENKRSYQEIEERRKERIAELTGRIEEGCRSVLNSESFRSYLQTMAKFHRYSFRNSMLIFMQKPDATMVASYTDWQRKFGRQVNKGEKGIQIIAPAPYKTKREIDKVDPVTGNVVFGTDGKPEKIVKEVTIPRFKAVSVFDIGQTNGRPLPTLGIKELQASVDNFDMFMESIRRTSPVPIRYDNIPGGAKGYYDRANKEIVIQVGMPELQTLKTACHELVHSMLHDDPSKMVLPDGTRKDKGIIETEAEGCALVCLSHFGFQDVGDYSFPYLVSYASSPDLTELHASLATIQETSSKVISGIETEMLQQMVDRDKSKTQEVQPEHDGQPNMPDASIDDGRTDPGAYTPPTSNRDTQVAEAFSSAGVRNSLLQGLRERQAEISKETKTARGTRVHEPRKEQVL